jgi:hypothetical protein
MRFNCAGCGEKTSAPHKIAKYYLGTSFCGVECLEAYIRECKPIDLALYPQIRRIQPGDVPNGFEVWSHRLGQGFRSGFECLVAERLVLDWKMATLYEMYCIEVAEGRTYSIDFYLPDYGVFLEVKGAWGTGSAKWKFEKAQEILGEDRVLLIPSPYRRWFEK